MSNKDTIPIHDGELMAVVDMGSNSFHLTVARVEHGQPRVIDRLRDNVRMAAGLRSDGSLDPGYLSRALECLARFGQRIAGIPSCRVRAIATHSVRKLAAPQSFLSAAEASLGHPIELVSGREEGRLIFLGVAHGLPLSQHEHRLVIDVGGGSTEFIIGRDLETLQTESVQIGCVASTLRFFPDGKLTRKRWQKASNNIGVLLQQFAENYRTTGWSTAYGSSGSAKAISSIVAAMQLSDQGFTAGSLATLREALLEQGRLDTLKLPGLSKERASVIAGATVIFETAFTVLGIKRLHACDSSMREGLLWDMLGRLEGCDPRSFSIHALARRYGVDHDQAQRVEATALLLFEQVATDWKLHDETREWLCWSARIHEIGLAIAHSQHHRHSSYILRHADLAGFSWQEQALLSTVLSAHRRKPDKSLFAVLPERYRKKAYHITALLRLAVLLRRSRRPEVLPPVVLTAAGPCLHLQLPRLWLSQHPLTEADLKQEISLLAELDLTLKVSAIPPQS